MFWHYLYDDRAYPSDPCAHDYWSDDEDDYTYDDNYEERLVPLQAQRYPTVIHGDMFVAEHFNRRYQNCKEALPNTPRRTKRWLAQYQFWMLYENYFEIEWTGGLPPREEREPERLAHLDNFGPASQTCPPRGCDLIWPFAEFYNRLADNNNIWPPSLVELDDDGEIIGMKWAEDDVVFHPFPEDHRPKPNHRSNSGVSDMQEDGVYPSSLRRLEDSSDQEDEFDDSIDRDNAPRLTTLPSSVPKTQYLVIKNLGNVKLQPEADTGLAGFETTKIQISTDRQQSLMANGHRELISLEVESGARILVFDPFRAQDGAISDTALGFIQGAPFARHQAVRLLTAFQTNLEIQPLDSNVNFRFLGPGRSRGKKKNTKRSK